MTLRVADWEQLHAPSRCGDDTMVAGALQVSVSGLWRTRKRLISTSSACRRLKLVQKLLSDSGELQLLASCDFPPLPASVRLFEKPSSRLAPGPADIGRHPPPPQFLFSSVQYHQAKKDRSPADKTDLAGRETYAFPMCGKTWLCGSSIPGSF